jgi:iron complex outermembrane receptor protein
MRLSVVVTAACMSIVGLSIADDVHASVRKYLNIPSQGLGPALNALAKQRGFQIVYVTEELNGYRTKGAVGEFTPEEALNKLLNGTGFTFRYVDGKTVTVLPIASSSDPASSTTSTAVSSSATAGDSSPQEKSKSYSGPFRVAQVDQGTSAAVGGATQSAGTSYESQPRLEEVIVTAQKREERLKDVPMPVSVVSATTLMENNEVRIQDFYNTIPGLTIIPTTAQNIQPLSIRGITTGLGTNPTAAVTVDDVPFTASTNVGGGNGSPDIDPSDLARVEVLRGPQGTLYGATSMGGILKFVTVDPSTNGYSGRFEVGTSDIYNSTGPGYNLRGAMNAPLSDDLAIRISGFKRYDAGYIDNPILGISGINPVYSEGFRAAALWKISSAVSLKISALNQDTDSAGSQDVTYGPGVNVGVGQLQQNYPRGVGLSKKSYQAYSAELKAEFDGFNITSITGYNINHYKDLWDFSHEFASLTQTQFGVTGASVPDDDTGGKFVQEVRVAGSAFQRLDWILGGFYTYETDLHSESILAANRTTGQVVGDWLDWTERNSYQESAVFANATYHVTDQLDVQFGGRESFMRVISNYYNSFGLLNTAHFAYPSASDTPENHADFTAFTYQVAPEYKISADSMVYARIATGYRPGQYNGAPVISGGSSFPLTVQPDQTTNYEVGTKSDFLDQRLAIDVSVYYIDWTGLQLFVTDPTTGFGYRINGGHAKSDGVEFSFNARPMQGLTVEGWVTVGDASLLSSFPTTSSAYGLKGDRLPFSSRFSSYLSAEERFPLTGKTTGFVGGSVAYVGDRLGQFSGNASTPRQDYPAYTQANLRTGVVYGGWTYNIFATNVANSHGIIAGGAGSFPSIGFLEIQPRTVGISLIRNF